MKPSSVNRAGGVRLAPVTIPVHDSDGFQRSRFAAPPPIMARPDEFDLSSGFRLLRRRFWLIAILTAVLTTALVPLILAMRPSYHAEARVMIRSSPATALDLSEKSDTPPDIASEMERMLSRASTDRVVRELGIADRQEFNPTLRDERIVDQVRNLIRGLIDRGTRRSQPAGEGDVMEAVVQSYYRALGLRRDGLSNVVQIGFDSEDPVLAASVPAKLLEVYVDERGAIERRRFEQIGNFIQSRIAEQRLRADEAREAVRHYRETVGPVSNEAQAAQFKAVEDLSARLKQLATDREQISGMIVDLTSPELDTALAKIDLPEPLATTFREVGAQARTLEQMLQVYGDNADEVVEIRSKLVATRSVLSAEVDHHIQLLRARLDTLDSERRSVTEELSVAQDRLTRSAQAQTELEGLLARAEAEQAALDAIEQQRRSLADRSAMPVSDVIEVLSPAGIPLAPQGRGRLFYLVAALGAAFAVSLTIAFLREMLDGSVRSQDQLAAAPGLVPAGLLPSMPRGRRQGRSSPVLRGVFGESIRAILVSLWQANGGEFPQSILVTSSLDHEGKSFVARALALELVAAGKSVLLVDGDLTRGDLGAEFGAGSRPGLNDLLSRRAELSDVIHHDEATGLDVIPRGGQPVPRRQHLPDLEAVLRFARGRGQLVIIDSAPVLASTDSIFLAQQVERTVVVIRWGRTSMRTVEVAASRLGEASRYPALTVLNMVNPRRYRLYGFRDAAIFSHSLAKYHPA